MHTNAGGILTESLQGYRNDPTSPRNRRRGQSFKLQHYLDEEASHRVPSQVAREEAYRIMVHKVREKEARELQARIQGKAARASVSYMQRRDEDEREAFLIKWVIAMQSAFRGRRARRKCR